MTEGILTKLSLAPSYQNLGQRARPSAEVLQNSGMDPIYTAPEQTQKEVDIATQFKVEVNQKHCKNADMQIS